MGGGGGSGYLYWMVSDVVDARSFVMRMRTMLKRKMKLICNLTHGGMAWAWVCARCWREGGGQGRDSAVPGLVSAPLLLSLHLHEPLYIPGPLPATSR